MLMRTYLHNNGERVTFSAIAEPQNDFDSIKAVLKAGLAHEQYVTSLINKIYQAADKVHDYRTMQCFDWFVKEQGEEEKNADDLIKKYKMFGSDAKGHVRQRCQRTVFSEPGIAGPYLCCSDISPVSFTIIP